MFEPINHLDMNVPSFVSIIVGYFHGIPKTRKKVDFSLIVKAPSHVKTIISIVAVKKHIYRHCRRDYKKSGQNEDVQKDDLPWGRSA
jgi:hypothetical protein